MILTRFDDGAQIERGIFSQGLMTPDGLTMRQCSNNLDTLYYLVI